MKSVRIGAGLVFGTAFWLALLGSGAPFDAVSAGLDRAFGAPPAWTQVKDLYRNPDRQELSGGARPLVSFERLSHYWSSGARVVFIGNSQMQAVSLARGEHPPSGPEKTWVDLVTDNLEKSPDSPKGYRLSAVGMSYAEALWYVLYLVSHPAVVPHAIFLQMNYQSLWNTGIRDGMLELLNDPEFHTLVAAEAGRGAGYSALFGELLEAAGGRRQATRAETADGGTPASRLEDAVRRELNRLPVYRQRNEQRDSFLDLLYRGRIYFLQLKPSTARTISGTRLRESQGAVDRIAELCQAHHIRLALLRVPANPRVSLYRVPEDRTRYVTYLQGLAGRFDISVYDMEDLVPANEWGLWYNGPDPLHMGRAGHRLLASRMIPVVERELQERR